jgi:hypothetical protein
MLNFSHKSGINNFDIFSQKVLNLSKGGINNYAIKKESQKSR